MILYNNSTVDRFKQWRKYSSAFRELGGTIFAGIIGPRLNLVGPKPNRDGPNFLRAEFSLDDLGRSRIRSGRFFLFFQPNFV